MNRSSGLLQVDPYPLRSYYIAVDGPNFICRLIEENYSHDVISNTLSIMQLSNHIQNVVRSNPGARLSIGTDFFYSHKRMGPRGNALSKEHQDFLIHKLQHETGVTVKPIFIRGGNSEKGVDVAIAMHLLKKSLICDVLVLVSSDKDYVPALEELRDRGKYIFTVGYEKSHPIELINLSFDFIDLKNAQSGLFISDA